MAPTPRIRPYKDFLTPALHRRFTSAAATLLIFCYVEAILLGQFDSLFWTWFPFGRAGIRTGLLFICAFSIFVLRVAQLHAGARTSHSEFQAFKDYALRYQTLQTAGWYLFSAWLFCEVFIFTAPSDANIKWFTDAEINGRPRLNERPIYLTTFFLILALVQTGFHIAYDYDRIELPLIKTSAGNSADGGKRLPAIITPSASLRRALPAIAQHSVQRALIMMCATPVIYSLFIRKSAWGYTLKFAKVFWKLPRSSALPLVKPFHLGLLARTFWGGFLLTMLWEVGNKAFSIYVSQEPLKNDRPITYESRDPNGSLLTGLKGKKLQTQAFAFWELALISERFEGRRKQIFEDIDRKDGSTYSQIYKICTQTINDMNKRIAEHMDPKLKEKEKTAEQKKQEEEADRGVPKIAGKLKEENIFTNPPRPKSTSGTLVEAVSTIAKAHGNTPHKPLTEGGRMLIGSAKSAVLTPEQEKNLTPQGIWAALEPYARKFLGSPVGWPFQQTYRRRITNVVLGTPYGEASIILDAVDILSRLAVCSLTEDSFGYVQRDIPDMIKNFSGSIATLEKLKQNIGFHWTDVEKNEHAPEVDAIILALKKGLQNILDAFGAYFNDLKISRAEVRVAEKAAMIEAPKKTEPAKEKTKEKPKEKPEEKPKEMSERRRR